MGQNLVHGDAGYDELLLWGKSFRNYIEKNKLNVCTQTPRSSRVKIFHRILNELAESLYAFQALISKQQQKKFFSFLMYQDFFIAKKKREGERRREGEISSIR